jgi:hypothetical protein
VLVAGIVPVAVVHRPASEDSPVALPTQRSYVVAEWVAVVVGTSAAVDTVVPVALLARPGVRLTMFLVMGQSPSQGWHYCSGQTLLAVALWMVLDLPDLSDFRSSGKMVSRLEEMCHNLNTA